MVQMPGGVLPASFFDETTGCLRAADTQQQYSSSVLQVCFGE